MTYKAVPSVVSGHLAGLVCPSLVSTARVTEPASKGAEKEGEGGGGGGTVNHKGGFFLATKGN